MIMAHEHHYVFVKQHDYDFMWLATFGMALSLTATFVYLLFYSLSEKWDKFFNFINYMGNLTVIFAYTFAFVGSELIGTSTYFPFMFIIGATYIVNIMLAQYEAGRIISLIISIVVISCAYAYDFSFYSSPKEKEVFYVPILIELAILGFGYALYYFQVPERWCRGVKFFQLYLTGWHFFSIMLVNFYFEASYILYYTFKVNSGNYDADNDNWYYLTPIFKK